MIEKYLSKNYRSLRYKYDLNLEIEAPQIEFNNDILLDSLYITKALSSYLYNKVERIKLLLDEKIDFKLFVTSSREINAYSFRHPEIGNVVMLNSELVEKFNSNELDFVIGHELGHLAFNHSCARYNIASDSSKNYYLELRNQEISSDRFAFMLVKDKSKAYKALFKLLTGLPNRLAFSNIQEYLHQIETESSIRTYSFKKTHPSIYVRLKALLLFESSQLYYDFMGYKEKAPIDYLKLERKIRQISLEIDSNLELEKIDILINKIITLTTILLNIEIQYNTRNSLNSMMYASYKKEIQNITNSEVLDIIKKIINRILGFHLLSRQELDNRIALSLKGKNLSENDYSKVIIFIKML
jgi:hypothetical protein